MIKPFYKMKYLLIMALFSVVTLTPPAHASEPKTFEDCVLKYLPGTGSDKAAVFIVEACARKFVSTFNTEEKDAPITSDSTDQ